MENQKNKIPRFQVFMEYTWLAIGILSFATWLFAIIQEGLENHYMLLIISLASFAMFFFRKYLRKQYTAPKNRDDGSEK